MQKEVFDRIVSRFILLTFLLGLSFTTGRGQTPVGGSQDKAKKPASSMATPAHVTQRQQETIDSLSLIIDDFTVSVDEKDFQVIPRRVEVACSSILLMWDFQPALEKVRLKKLISKLRVAFIENYFNKKDSRGYLKQAIRFSIGTLTKKDKEAALVSTKEFYESLGGLVSQMNSSEKLEFAEDLLDIDPERSERLVEQIIATSVPKGAIGYLSKLKLVSTTLHDQLYRRILNNLSTGSIYSFRSELIIQSYVFKRTYIVSPTAGKVDVPGMKGIAFPAGNVDINNREIFKDLSPDPIETNQYIAASISGLERKLQVVPIQNGFDGAQVYFVACKIQAYENFSTESSQNYAVRLEPLLANIATVAANAGVTTENLAHLKFMAISVVTNHFENSLSDLVKDHLTDQDSPSMRARVLENSVLRKISEKEFDEAEKLIEEVLDTKTSQALQDFLNYSIIANAGKNLTNTDFIDARLAKISDLNVKTLAFLEASKIALDSKKRSLAGDYLFEADRIIANQLSAIDRSQMAMSYTAIALKLDKKKYMVGFTQAVRFLNTRESTLTETEKSKNIYAIKYRGDSVRLFSRGVAGGGIAYSSAGSDIENVFGLAAYNDWDGTLQYATHLDDPLLRIKAAFGVAKIVLGQKSFAK